MKKLIIFILVLFFTSIFASAYPTYKTPIHVKGYSKKDGTYVQQYWRAKPYTYSYKSSRSYK